MRFLLFPLFILLLSISSVQAGNGSFLILKRVYFYHNANKSGKRYLTRTQKAYEVVDVAAMSKNSVMYRIIVPQSNNLVNGAGFIVETEAEIRKLGTRPVKIYSKVLTINSDFTSFQLVPATQLSFSGRQEQSPDFPNISWKAVNYRTSAPMVYWVPDWSGVYRPDKNAEWLNRTFQKAGRLKLGESLLQKILMGTVEAGFTREQVELTLGEPVEKKHLDNDRQEEWQYKGRKIVFESNLVLRIL